MPHMHQVVIPKDTPGLEIDNQTHAWSCVCPCSFFAVAPFSPAPLMCDECQWFAETVREDLA